MKEAYLSKTLTFNFLISTINMITFSYISFCSYLLASLLSLVFGLIYLLRSKFMPYHAEAVNKSWNEVDGKFRILIIALMRVSGGGMLSSSLAIGILLFIPFIHGEGWANFAILIMGLSASIPILIATLIVKLNSPARPPVMASVAAIVLLLTGFLFTVIN